jgi:hypothetical protein
MTAVWLPPWALIIALQAITASASIGRLTTRYYIVSRAYNALALGAVAADFAIKYFVTGRGDDLTSGIVFTHRADDLTGLLVFSVLALRTLLILCIGSLDRSLLARRITCAVTFAVCVACTIVAQYIGIYPFRLVALLPAIGIGFGCLGEASDDGVVRRRCILALGCILAVFAFETSAWGLMFKNLLSDAGASAYNMLRYRDPPPWAPFSRGQLVRNDVMAGERQGSTELLAETPLSRRADLDGDGAAEHWPEWRASDR